MYFSKNILGVNPVVMNYKIESASMRPARYSLVWPDCFSVIICGGRNTEKQSGYARLRARKACSVCELAHR